MFNHIIGNNTVKKTLETSIINKQVSHSYMFVGVDGIGKKQIAIEFAKSLLCDEKETYCNKCKSCIEFDSENHPDFYIVKPEKNEIKIDQIRELQKRVQEKPIISNKKVYIIDNADCMNTKAQNCLLKTLEEPPSFVTIILIGTNENAFLNTIKSRCMIIHFTPLKNDEILKYIDINFKDMEITEFMLDIFQGSIAKVVSLKDKIDTYKEIYIKLKNVNKLDLIDFVKGCEILYQSKDEIIEILEYLNIVLLKFAKEDIRYVECINIVEDTKNRIKQNCNYDMCIDNMLWNIWEAIN